MPTSYVDGYAYTTCRGGSGEAWRRPPLGSKKSVSDARSSDMRRRREEAGTDGESEQVKRRRHAVRGMGRVAEGGDRGRGLLAAKAGGGRIVGGS